MHFTIYNPAILFFKYLKKQSNLKLSLYHKLVHHLIQLH